MVATALVTHDCREAGGHNGFLGDVAKGDPGETVVAVTTGCGHSQRGAVLGHQEAGRHTLYHRAAGRL